MTEALLEEAYAEGYLAYQSQLPEHANPYANGTMDHELWSDGYDDAHEDEKYV